jgi:hypothetical protein
MHGDRSLTNAKARAKAAGYTHAVSMRSGVTLGTGQFSERQQYSAAGSKFNIQFAQGVPHGGLYLGAKGARLCAVLLSKGVLDSSVYRTYHQSASARMKALGESITKNDPKKRKLQILGAPGDELFIAQESPPVLALTVNY